MVGKRGERLADMKYSDIDIIREYRRSSTAESVAKKMGISIREVNRALKKASIQKVDLHRFELNEKELNLGLGKTDFLE